MNKVILMGRLTRAAEFAEKYLHQGTKVLVTGKEEVIIW